MTLLLTALVFLAIGGALGWLFARNRTVDPGNAELAVAHQQLHHATDRIARLEADQNILGLQTTELRERNAVLETQLEHAHQRFEERTQSEALLTAEFEKLSRATLKETSEGLMKVAESSFKMASQSAKHDLDQQRTKIEHLVKPVQENLNKLEQFIATSEKTRNEQFGGLFEQLQTVAATNKEVQAEAAQLKNVLRTSSASRGRWGEVQLRRVVELAGMCEHSDFSEQESVTTEDGRSRADLIVYLPGDIKIAVDAKVPYGAYEQGQSTEDPVAQKQLFIDHAKQFRNHVDALAKRKYWEQYTPSCGFTVLFVPGDALLDTALAHDTGLWEQAAEKQILLATPSTLIAMLRMAAIGWRQESQANNAEQIARVGKELLKRLTTANNHVEKMGRALKSAVGSYNDFVGTYENRLQPQARKLANLSGGEFAHKELGEITEPPRQLRKKRYDDDESEVEVLELTEHFEAS